MKARLLAKFSSLGKKKEEDSPKEASPKPAAEPQAAAEDTPPVVSSDEVPVMSLDDDDAPPVMSLDDDDGVPVMSLDGDDLGADEEEEKDKYSFPINDWDECILDWTLDESSIALCAYETLLLAMNCLFDDDDEKDIETLEFSMRSNLGMSRTVHKRTLANLQYKGDCGDTSKSSLAYRFELLSKKRPQEFDNPRSFMEWFERHLQFLTQAVACLVHAGPNTFEINGEIMPREDLEDQFKLDFHNLANDFVRNEWWKVMSPEYQEALAAIQTTFSSAASQIENTTTTVAFPLSVLLYERLVPSCFDSLEGGLELVDTLDETMAVLGRLRPQVEVSTHMHTVCLAKAFFERYEASQEFHVLEKLEAQAEAVAAILESAKFEGLDNKPDARAVEYATLFVKYLGQFFEARFNDTNHWFPKKKYSHFRPELTMYMHLRAGANPDWSSAKMNALVSEFIANYTRAYYERVVDGFARPLNVDDLKELVTTLSQDIDIEWDEFAPVWQEQLGESSKLTAIGLYLNSLAELFAPDLAAAMDHMRGLDMNSADLLEKLSQLEERMGLDPNCGAQQMMDLEKSCRRLASEWIAAQRGTFAPFMQEVTRQCKWTRLSEEFGHCAMAGDLFQLFSQTLGVFAAMNIPHGYAFLKPLLKSICNTLEEFAAFCLKGTEVPPCPIRPPPISNHKDKEAIAELFPEELIPTYEQLSVEELIVRLNSLDFSCQQLNSVKEQVLNIAPRAPVEIFDHTTTKVKKSCGDMRKFLAAKVVMYDLQGPLLKSLYVPSVSECRLNSVISRFEGTMEMLYGDVNEAQAEGLVTNVLVTFLDAYVFVLLEGGLKRRFTVMDHRYFLQDLELLCNLFLCRDESGEAQGLPEKIVHSCSRGATELVNELFSKESRVLVDLYEKSPETNVGKPQSKYNIFRVLRHRAKTDPVAKKFTKKFKNDAKLREYIKDLGR